MMENSDVLFQASSGIARLTLNRPEVLNSINRPLSGLLWDLLDQCAEDPNVGVILLTGAGRAFCAGQDLDEALPRDGTPAPDIGDLVENHYNPLIIKIRSIEKPIICAVNGIAAGAGANIALVCDFVLAAQEAYFMQAFVRIGLIPDCGGTFTLPRLTGLANATALMMLGDKISAEEAMRHGLIYAVHPAEQLMPESEKLARRLADGPSKTLGLIKRAINSSMFYGFEAQLDIERELQSIAAGSEDFREGVTAFLEKRKPSFTGK
jgi:2-(1,2-epoxy-1,2-dihydrophenyl)acetyl-CoA isomerase